MVRKVSEAVEQDDFAVAVSRGARWISAFALVGAVTIGVAAQRSQQPAFTLEPIGSRVWAAIDNPKSSSPAAANAGFVIGDDGVLIIDTFADAEAARALFAEIRKTTNLPIRFVVNTHYHLDHVAGNGVFAETGAIVLAQRNVRSWIHAENLRLITDGATAAHVEVPADLRARVDAFVAPSALYDTATTIHLGSREVRVRSYPGHTGGDSVVLIPDARVAFAGDLFWRRNIPNTIDASTKPWIDTLNTLEADNAAYTFVPGHGDVGNVGDVAAFRDYLVTLRRLIANAQGQRRSAADVEHFVLPQLRSTFGRWAYFKENAPSNIRETDAELRGVKRIPQSEPSLR